MPAADRNNDLDRLACLQAMGLTLYSSRRDLPGAAPSRRVLTPAAFTAAPSPEEAPATAPEAIRGTPTARDYTPGTLARSLDAPKSRPTARTEAPAPAAMTGADAVRFRLAAVVAGGALWLEELGDAPLAREQVALVHAMARACGWAVEAPRVQEFAWPMHRNPQLDQGATAAAAALQAFLARLVGEAGLGRILLLGSSARELAGRLTLPVPAASLPPTRSMLAGAAAKREAWLVLRELAQS
ncbi:hypothetical protein [Pseudohaliea sp.]|uniref:hypothetical protein n=1 Tax=Pseudohaliea sp. TaxID=2740289 RepID=UPI0032ECB4A0